LAPRVFDAVDDLADHELDVNTTQIVGTDLRMGEQRTVTWRSP
jgi:hypothetical protein